MAHDRSHRPFVEVDVFTAEAYRGNPLAVVLDGTGLSDDEMQRFANWTNLSETTFLVPPTQPGADYRVRIFTTTVELPFAGHPTLGSCHAWLEHGGTPAHPDRIVQECGVGLVTVARADDGRLEFAAPPLLRDGPLDDATLDAAVRVLGIVATRWWTLPGSTTAPAGWVCCCRRPSGCSRSPRSTPI